MMYWMTTPFYANSPNGVKGRTNCRHRQKFIATRAYAKTASKKMCTLCNYVKANKGTMINA